MTLQPTTPQQQTLINLLFSLRYITRVQFQQYLGNYDPSNTNRHLKYLIDKRYMKRVGEGSEEEKGSSKPATYCIGRNGIRLIAQLRGLKVDDLKNRYKDGRHSEAFIDHHMLLTTIFLQFREGAGEKDTKLTFQTKSDFEKDSYLARFSPDAYIVEETEDKKKISLLEIIDIEAQRFVLKRRIRSVIKLFLSNSLEVETGENFPTILFICPTKELQGFMKNYIKKIQENQGEDIIFKFTTYEKVKKSGVNSKIWKGVQETK